MFGGFGQNNNSQPQQNNGFGGFGSNNNAAGSGFGQPQNTGFGSGANNTGGGLFGSSNNNAFGTGASGFGASTSNSNLFGGANKPAFGTPATSSGSLFGNGATATTGASNGFSGFGAQNNTSNNSSPFNTQNNGSLFGGANKPAFGGANTGSGLFGSGSSANSFGPGNNQSTSVFGPQSTALGGNNTECQGTGSTPFQAYTEKEGAGSTTTNHFQSISFMPPYQKFSFEELRTADYNQGRRYGNSNGQAGAFGSSTPFGGFGQQNTGGAFGTSAPATSGSLFSNPPTSTSSPFGGTQTAGAGFGSSSTSGNIFGAKPTGSSTFNAQSSAPQTSNLFGTTSQPALSTGSANGFENNTGTSSLFGNGAQQQQKPGFSFGGTGTANTGGFGAAAGPSSATGGGLFGTAQQSQQPVASNPFGGFGTGQQNQNQPNTGSAFAGFGGNNQQQQKSGSIFGSNPSTTTGGGLFGTNNQANNQQSSAPSLFGNTNNNQSSGASLFGPKPATTAAGSSLFGTNNATNSNSTGSGLFGGGGFGNNSNGQNQQNQTSNLFGTTQQQKPGSTFGSTAPAIGGSLFNTNNNQQPSGGSIFGGLGNGTQTQQQPSGLFGMNNSGSSSIYNNSQQQQNPLQAPETMTTSLSAANPWGSSSIFSGLPPPPQMNAGPIATPISGGQKTRKPAILPQFKINPNASTRLVTPQKRGYGFSYSTYGTPSSISSNASTPGGLSSSLLAGSIGRGLGKSLSTSNLRRTFDSDGDSLLSPGAFSAGSSRQPGTGSLKRLTIDRTLRTDLFGSQGVTTLPSSEKEDPSRQPGILKKKVSFDTSTIGGNGTESDGNGYGLTDRTEISSATPTAQEQGFLRSPSRNNGIFGGPHSNGAPAQSQMGQVKGNELAIVHEDGSPEPLPAPSRVPLQNPQVDPEPGQYYMVPSRDELRKMSREQLKKISGFVVGRQGCGHVVFDRPVDITTVNLDDIFDNIAVITVRSLTVYPDPAKKPARGKGLNVPSTITLENSWPRQKDKTTPLFEKSGPRFQKHVDRLRGVKGTEFVKYDKDTGAWVFKVPHFTTYALDFDDDASEGESLQTSTMSAMPDTPTPKTRNPRHQYTPMPIASREDSSILTNDLSQISSGPEDTFEFKKKGLPGSFEDAVTIDDDQEMEEIDDNEDSFLEDGSSASPSDSGVDEPSELEEVSAELDDGSVVVEENEMDTVGHEPKPLSIENALMPKSILKASQPPLITFGTPGKPNFNVTGDWAEQLQRTISPRKQDRQALRACQATLLNDRDADNDNTPRALSDKNGTGQEFATSIDLMNSIFGKEQARKSGRGVKQGTKGKGFEWPYSKKSKTYDGDENDMLEMEQEYHKSYKPNWGPGGALLYAMPSTIDLSRMKSTQTDAILKDQAGALVSEGKDIRFAKLTATLGLVPETLDKQRAYTEFSLDQKVPFASTQRIPFEVIRPGSLHKSSNERYVWELARILFDDYDDDISKGVPAAERSSFEHRIRKDRLSVFWQSLCQNSATEAVAIAPTAEERAIAYLSAKKVTEACDTLIEGKDFRLATLVAQIGGDHIMREDMTTQIIEWRRLNVLSEMTEPIRALYELLAGNTCLCEGKKGPLEDRAKTFVLSDRFNLDWKRVFGFKLWYAVLAEEPIEAAVEKYAADLGRDEGKKPVPSFIEGGADLLWHDNDKDEREDVLWGLLKLYASSKVFATTASVIDVIMPQNTTGNPVDARLSFQLYHTLTARFPTDDTAKADQLAWDFAAQLESGGEWIWAIFALLHLSDQKQRQGALQSILAHHAVEITDVDSSQFKTLTQEFKIPEPWIWEAVALYARSVEQDHAKEVEYLLKAENWEEAHKTLCRIVAPQAVIEQDYDRLQQLLNGFYNKDKVRNWYSGGQVYEDYARLIRGVSAQERNGVLKRLLNALPSMVNERPRELAFAEMIAVQEMSRVVGRAILDGKIKGIEGAKVLQLPLTEDAYLQNTVDLSLQYYRAVMAAGG